MNGFTFDLQRFATQTISANKTFTLDGVTYTAVDGAATLNLDDGKISGLAKGKVSAVVTNATDSPTIIFDASDGALTFTATSDGKVISITPYPIEFIGGEFTYKGNKISISAGSDLALVTKRGDFILRNQNHFEYDSSYTFTSTALISDGERVISDFSLTNGTDVRELHLEQLGKVINYFTEQGFTLVKGSSEVLNIGDYKLTATAAKADAGLNLDLGEDGMTFVPNTGDGTLNVALSRGDTEIFSGELECTKGTITFGYNHEVTFAKDTSFNFTTKNNSVLTVTANDEATTNIALTNDGITFTPGNGDGGLDISLSKKGTKVFEGSLNITDGTINFNPTTKQFSFSDGTKIALGIFGLELGIEVVGNTTVGEGSGVNFGIAADANGNLIFTPDENGGSFNISLKRDDTTLTQNNDASDDSFFENNVTVNGPIMFNPETKLLTLKDGTEISLAFDNYTMTATADGDASSKISLTEDGISIMPEIGDGKLNLALGNKKGSMSVDVEILSGGFVFGDNGTLNVVKDTELQIKFSDNYIVNFKTTDAAGGAISINSDGINFAPNSEDGGLQLSVTKNGETRTASLDVTGSLTYKLDGSITLAKDTVVKNVFEDGNILTITANTDASGSIIFNPQNGLTIEPSTTDALNVVLTTGDLEVVNISSIDGSINYSGGLVTASDGTQAHLLVYGEWESELRTDGGTASLEFTADRTVYTANEGATFVLDYLDGSTVEIQDGSFTDIYATETSDAIEVISAGSNFKCNDEEFTFTLEKAGSYTLNGMNVTTTEDNVQVQLSNYKTIIVDGISYTPLDKKVTLKIDGDVATVSGGKVSLQMDGFSEVFSYNTTKGSIAYDSSTNKFSVTKGTKTYIKGGKFPDQFVAQGDFEINVEKNSDDTFTFTTDDTAAVAIQRKGKTIMSTTMTLDGSIIADPTNNQITVPKDTLLTMTPGNGMKLEIKALDDAGGKLSLVKGGIRFAPNENDGALELNFINAERKVQLDVTGAFTYKGLGALSVEDGTVANFKWEDGNTLKITSTGSTGSIGLDPDKGIKITSDDENLNMTFTTPSMSTDISGVKGTLYYNAGDISFDENSKLTATTTLGGQPILTTLETVGGTGHISFNTTNGVLYAADTGALKVTWSRGDLESTFTVNEGSVQIGHNLFQIAEGSDIATDLKNFVPAFYFTTAEAGNYTINGQKITTSAKGLALTATDDYMVFKTSDDVVTYDGMTFAGSGNVSLTPDEVFLGAGVVANGFGEGNSFVLTEVGTVTADEKIFELNGRTYVKDGEEVEVPLKVTVTGAEDGFIFSRTLTQESEEAIEADPPLVGSVFTEKFISHGDSSYRTVTDPIGLEEVIGISDGATIMGGASLDGEPTYNYFDIVTDTTGTFTIGERAYVISAGTSLGTKLTAHFDEEGQAYARGVKDLNGTVSGDFSAHSFEVNGSSSMQVFGDTDVSIVADTGGFEILGLDAGAKLLVSAAGTYNVNSTEIAANMPGFIVGTADGSAQLYPLPSILADFMLHKTEAGYPQMAALAFHPDEANPDAPTNYYSAEQWTTTSTDNLQLSAIHYSPENPTGKWVILVHGYGKIGAAMNSFAESYLDQGMDVLIIDQRAAGDSEGDWLTMGVAEANDLAIWTQEIAKTNANAQITLHGVSMGAATVMLAAALPKTANVSGIIEDCGYGNIADVFAALMYGYGSNFGVSGVDFYELFGDVGEVAKILDGGYNVADAAPIDSIGAVTVPSLFIHGADDSAIPSTNADALYEASGASNKTKLIIEGADHAKSVEIDSEAYFTAVRNLIASSTSEIGASIVSDVNNKLLRGTIYNDTITTSGTTVTIQALGGDDYIFNNVDSSLVAAELGNSIDAGDGNDTIYSYHSYNPTLLGGEGDDSIVVEKGHLSYIDGGAGNDTIIGTSQEGGWGMGNSATVLGGEGDDFINPIYSANASIDGGEGNDTIFANGENATIDGGAGNNLIRLTDAEGGVTGKFVVFNGDTTVESFNTGFGEGSDTIYIDGDPAGVYFNDSVLVFANDNASLTMSDVTTTAKVNIYHERRQVLNKGVFIADNDWYSVTSSDLSVSSGEEVYFVGPSANPNHGVDFSGISAALNLTLDTAYIDSEDYVPTTTWINGVYSIRGGAGLTTITGSDKSDTIITGSGSTTINASGGDDLISLTGGAHFIQYASGDGNDTIHGFDENSTLKIDDEISSWTSGDDVIVNIGGESIILVEAAKFSKLNIKDGLPAEKVIESLTGNRDYGTQITDQSAVETLLESGDLDGNMSLLLENKSADFSASTGRKLVTLKGSAAQEVAFNDAGYNVAVVDEDSRGEKNISLGDGDLVIVEETSAQVNITAGTGNDSIYSHGENVSVSLNGGDTALFVRGGNMTVNGYDASTDSGFHTNYSDIFTAVDTGEIFFDNGKLTIGKAVIIDKDGNNLVNLFNAKDKLQKVGEALENTTLDLSSETANWIFSADEYSTLVAGSGDDSIFAFAGSQVDAGAGRNYVEIKERSANAAGATIVLNDSGQNTIANFTAGFDDTSDILFVDVEDVIDFKFDGTNLVAQNNDNKRCGFLKDIASDAPFTNIWVEDANAPVKVAVAQKNAVITVDDELADYYEGDNSGVDFTNYEGSLFLNFASEETSIGAGEILFRGINQVTLGSGQGTLIGSDAKETLTAGTGDNSIWGAAGNDLLVGNKSAAKDGATEFFFTTGDGHDTIKNFEFLADDSTTADKINVGDNAVTDVAITNGNVRVQIGDDWLTLEDAQGESFRINDFVAKVDSTKLAFEDAANFYVATGHNATLTVGKDVETNAVIWLGDPDRNGSYFVGDIKTLDASKAQVNVELAGNDLDNTIIAGNGDASLWGGDHGNDLLVGGKGHNMFFYCNGDGNDSVTGVNNGDLVYLAGVTLDQIVGADFGRDAVALNFSNGDKLTVNDKGKDLGFVVGEQTFYVNNERNSFSTEK